MPETQAIQNVSPNPERSALLREAVEGVRSAFARGDLDGAAEICGMLVHVNPDEAAFRALQGQVLRAQGKSSDADAAETRAVAIVAKRLEKQAKRGRVLSLGERMLAFSDVLFLGGPPATFVALGQMQLLVMLEQGMESHHRVLDVGCGTLRAGIWLMKVLEKGNYFGIEPHQARLDFGKEHVAGPALMDRKQPRFDGNAAFDFSVFGERFDFVVARSVWTHTSKLQINAMLDAFAAHSAPGAVLLTSYLPVSDGRPDYLGEQWVGRSADSPVGGLVAHKTEWVQAACKQRGLRVRALADHVVNGQIWLRIEQI